MNKPATPRLAAELTRTCLLLVAVSLLVTGMALIAISYDSQRSQLVQAQRAKAQVASMKISSYLDGLQRKLAFLSRLRGLSSFDADARRSLLEGLINMNKAYVSVGLVDARGRLLLALSPAGERAREDWSGEAAFKRSYRSEEDFVGAVEPGIEGRAPTLLLAVPIRGWDNRIDGMAYARVDLGYLWAVLDEVRPGDRGYMYVVDQRDLVIARSDELPGQTRLVDLSRLALGRILDTRQAAAAPAYMGLRGRRVIGQVIPVAIVNWRLVVELPTAAANAALRRLIGLMAACLAAALLASVLIVLRKAERISRPLLALTHAATLLRLGQLETRVAGGEGNELGLLAEAFNQMAARLGETIAELNREVAERIRAGDSLRESEARLRRILETVPDGVVIVDSQGDLSYANPAAAVIFGLSDDVAEGRSHKALASRVVSVDGSPFPAEDLPFHRVLRAHESVAGIQLATTNGRGGLTILSVNAAPLHDKAGGFAGVVATLADITEIKKAEEELRRSQAFLESVIECSPNSMWISDESGTMLRMNQALRDSLRLRDEEVVGKYNILRDSVIKAQGLLPAVREVFEKGRGVRFVTDYDTGAVEGLELGDRARVILDVNVSPIVDGTGKVTNAIVQHVDISEIKRTEAELQKALEENRRLLSELQHRAKNSFNMILGMISLTDTGESAEARAVVEVLSTRVASVAELYSLLYRSGNFSEVQLDDYCRRVAAPLVSLAGAITLVFDLASVRIPVKEAAPLGLILTELVTNAVKYAFPDGRPGRIVVSLGLTEAGASLRVRDDGVGLPAGFDAGSSPGMGLKLMKGLAAQINAGFRVVALDEGSEGVVDFPLRSG
jgi:PAS domain S-box-containing protein